jgi:maltokinase
MLSVDYIGRVTDKRSDFRLTAAVDEWSARAREELLAAYRSELVVADRPELLDERLLTAFQAEQVCRELLYAFEYQPRWAYAPLAGLRRMMSAEVEESPPAGRHRAAPQPHHPGHSGSPRTGGRAGTAPRGR